MKRTDQRITAVDAEGSTSIEYTLLGGYFELDFIWFLEQNIPTTYVVLGWLKNSHYFGTFLPYRGGCWFIFLQKESSFSPHQSHHELNQHEVSGENQSICFCSRPKLQFKDSRRWESTGRSIRSLDSFLCPCYHATNNSPGFQDWEQVVWHAALKDSHWTVLWWQMGRQKERRK